MIDRYTTGLNKFSLKNDAHPKNELCFNVAPTIYLLNEGATNTRVVKALAHSVFAFIFCIAIFELAIPETNKVVVLLSSTVALTLASIPDIDERMPKRLVHHRSGVTHSIFTIVACACFSYVLLSRYPPLDLLVVPALTAAVASHILLDTLTRSGCPLLWPLSRHSFSAHLCKYDNPLANALIVLLSSLAILTFILCG